MSLEIAAKKLAAKGRHGDTQLVHMHPQEVAGLQALARLHGTSMTVNPETGLPEAFSLRSMLPMLAGAAMTYFSGGAINPYMAAGLVGAGTAASSGSINKGLLAGLGAYGGAGLGGGLMGSAAEGMGAADTASALDQPLYSGAGTGLDTAGASLQGAPGDAGLGLDTSGVSPATGDASGQLGATTSGTGLQYGTADTTVPGWQAGSDGRAAFSDLSAGDKFSKLGEGSTWTGAAGHIKNPMQAALMAAAPALMEAPAQPGAPKVPGAIRPYTLTRENVSGQAPTSAERQQIRDIWTAGPVRAVAGGGILRLASGGQASTTGAYRPEQIYGAGQTGAYNPTATYGAGAVPTAGLARLAAAASPQTAPAADYSSAAPAYGKYMYDPGSGQFNVNPNWQASQAAAQKAAAFTFSNQDAATYAAGGIASLGGYSDGGRLLRGPGDGVSDSIPATIGDKQPARLADSEFVIPARIVSELGNGSTEAGARQLYAMMERVQQRRVKSMGKDGIAKDTKAYKELPA